MNISLRTLVDLGPCPKGLGEKDGMEKVREVEREREIKEKRRNKTSR